VNTEYARMKSKRPRSGGGRRGTPLGLYRA